MGLFLVPTKEEQFSPPLPQTPTQWQEMLKRSEAEPNAHGLMGHNIYSNNLTLEIGKHKSNFILTLPLASSFLQICNNKQELNTIRIMFDNKVVLDS